MAHQPIRRAAASAKVRLRARSDEARDLRLASPRKQRLENQGHGEPNRRERYGSRGAGGCATVAQCMPNLICLISSVRE